MSKSTKSITRIIGLIGEIEDDSQRSGQFLDKLIILNCTACRHLVKAIARLLESKEVCRE